MNKFTTSFPITYHPSWDIQDSTKVQCYQSCPRMYFYEYVLGWRSSRPNNHLWFGHCVHKALEYVILNGYKSESVMTAMEMFNSEYRSKFPDTTDEIFTPKTPQRFFDMMILYLKEYYNDHSRYDVYKTEIGGTIMLSDVHKMAFKMDTILYDKAKRKYFSLEHKTKGGYINDIYIYDFLLSTQVGTYTHVLNCLFNPDDVDGVMINCLCLKKTKAPSFDFRRFPAFLSNSQMLVWMENTKMWLDEIEKNFEILSNTSHDDPIMKCFPLNGRSCTSWNRICQYHDLCTSWQNPTRHESQIPLDMEINFWNPLEEDLTEVMTI